jgi:biotin operon repressor
MRAIDPYQRRASITELLVVEPMSTAELAQALNVPIMNIRSDISALKDKGFVFCSGWGKKVRLFSARRIVLAEELHPRSSAERREQGYANMDTLPPSLHLMFGYTKHEPVGGKFIDNAEFHPTPTRTAPVKVYPGTVWGQMMEMAL